ncbi:MAG: DNA mismatch repair protein MutL [Rickettsiales bacterium]|nr:DNA mismatch repair protein MutL [Rickettsiales bacterium]|tara:strand:+ start:1395 stop:3155 length:1761 start_codon:yes stop_codon:yes gene_type:complete
MNKIKILPDEIINQIAAGEVLDRPSSAVKELIENSVDANSKKISIFIRDGGKTEIVITDDGDGIPKQELELAVKRHATSKLNEKKIDTLSFLGFRGEALPSIGSVSEMIIKSNTNDDQNGMMIEVISGIKKKIKPINHRKGTTVSIKKLFFSTPARLKFLKTDNYESLLIKRIVQKLALCNYEIDFDLTINNKKAILTKNDNSNDKKKKLERRVSTLLGSEFIDNSIFISEISENFKFKGFLGIPTFHHSNTNNQFLFVNGRVVQDKSMNIIFKVAYRDFMSYDRFPQLVLFIECSQDEVDVNVHPSKNEMRFRNLNFLRSKILKVFKSNLIKAGHRASTLNTVKAIEKFSFKSNQKTFLQLKDEKFNDDNLNNLNHSYDKNNIDESDKENSSLFPLGYAKSQFHKTYIISETNEGIIIIDQHAAHERLVYERLKKDFFEKKIKTQILLIPVVIDIDSSIIKNLEKKLQQVCEYGVKIEIFGKSSVIVRELPHILANCNVKKLVIDLIEEVVDTDDSKSVENEINKICSKMACHGSIRAGRDLQVDEMNDLLRKMETTPFSGQCNHGRPTYVELKIGDIEKLFGRK